MQTFREDNKRLFLGTRKDRVRVAFYNAAGPRLFKSQLETPKSEYQVSDDNYEGGVIFSAALGIGD